MCVCTGVYGEEEFGVGAETKGINERPSCPAPVPSLGAQQGESVG